MPRLLFISAAAVLLVQGQISAAQAQSSPGSGLLDPAAPNSFLLDPQLEKDADKIRKQTFSKPIGQRQNWNLGIGYHDREDPDDPIDLRERAPDQNNNFTGMRLSVPLGKKK